MGETRVRKTDGSTTVMRGGRIVGNLPSSGALSPVSGETLGTRGLPGLPEDSSPNVENLYSLFVEQNSPEALETAQDDFQSWVLHAAFATEEDTTRGRFWEGATRYATTPEGRAALERIVANSETTASLRTAAGAMLAEVELYGDDIRGGWLVPASQMEKQPPLAEVFIEKEAHVSSDSKDRLSPDTRVLGKSEVTYESETKGAVTLLNAKLHDASVADSVIEDSSVDHAQVSNSTVTGALIGDRRSSSTRGQAHFPISVFGSNVGPGGSVTGATVRDSQVHGEVVGTGTNEAGLAGTDTIGHYYESYKDGWGDTHSERARVSIGQAADEATHARVIRSTVGQGSKVRNAHLDTVVLKDGADVDTAVVENSTLEGTAHIAGTFTHERKNLEGYRILQEIIPRDRRARVSNVKLTREYIGEAAEVTKQSHVKSVARDGMIVTAYRTRFRTRMRRAVWAYTTTTVDPRTGSLKREFVGYDHGDESSAAVQNLKKIL